MRAQLSKSGCVSSATFHLSFLLEVVVESSGVLLGVSLEVFCLKMLGNIQCWGSLYLQEHATKFKLRTWRTRGCTTVLAFERFVTEQHFLLENGFCKPRNGIFGNVSYLLQIVWIPQLKSYT